MTAPQPFIKLEPGIAALLALLGLVHAIRFLLPAPAGLWFAYALTFNPARYAGYAEVLPGGEIAAVLSFVSYALVHVSLSHLFFNSVWILTFGNVIMRRLGETRFLGFAAVCAVSGAVAYLFLRWGSDTPMAGASGVVSGLIAAVLRLLPSANSRAGFLLLRSAPERLPLLPLREALRDPRLLAVSLLWLALNVLAGAGIPYSDVAVAWEAHVGGYVAGFALFDLFQPQPLLKPGATPSSEDHENTPPDQPPSS